MSQDLTTEEIKDLLGKLNEWLNKPSFGVTEIPQLAELYAIWEQERMINQWQPLSTTIPNEVYELDPNLKFSVSQINKLTDLRRLYSTVFDAALENINDPDKARLRFDEVKNESVPQAEPINVAPKKEKKLKEDEIKNVFIALHNSLNNSKMSRPTEEYIKMIAQLDALRRKISSQENAKDSKQLINDLTGAFPVNWMALQQIKRNNQLIFKQEEKAVDTKNLRENYNNIFLNTALTTELKETSTPKVAIEKKAPITPTKLSTTSISGTLNANNNLKKEKYVVEEILKDQTPTEIPTILQKQKTEKNTNAFKEMGKQVKSIAKKVMEKIHPAERIESTQKHLSTLFAKTKLLSREKRTANNAEPPKPTKK